MARQTQPGNEHVPHASLHFDLKNPRFTEAFASNEDAVEFLIKNADVDELVTSIQSSGWVDFEPLVADTRTKTVFEGNRRLAALRLLTDAKLRHRLGYVLPKTDEPRELPTNIQVKWVSNREEARSYIAFKHINGPYKWDALSKARFATDWLDQGEPVERVAKQIGDNHKTVLRLVNGWRVLQQAEKNDFDRADITAGRLNFSHLYTALARPNAREFLSLPEEPSTVLSANPVPKQALSNLGEFMGWLYGQSRLRRQHVIKSQNPDLNRLVQVLGNKKSLNILRTTKDLAIAFEEIEPSSSRFEEALAGSLTWAERALGLVAHFEPEVQAPLSGTIKNLVSTVRSLRDEMKRKTAQDDDL